MLEFLKKKWWKFLGGGLLLYVLVGGLLVPLGPGITVVQPSEMGANKSFQIQLTGFNTHFVSGGALQCFLKNGASYFLPNKLTAIDEEHLLLDVSFSAAQTKQFALHTLDVIVNTNRDGNVTLREAIAITDNASDTTAHPEMEAKVTNPEVEHNRYEGFAFPYREILYQSIRNTFYHVPMWFGMLFLIVLSVVYSVKYLNSQNLLYDTIAAESVHVALLYGILGLATGMMWATYTWGEPWPNDPKLNGAAIGVLMYFAYVILRGSLDHQVKRARISAVYNIFAAVFFIAFIFIIPRLTDSLHPGNGGNPAFSKYDLDSRLRLFFYPAVIGWILLALWIASIRIRMKLLEEKA
ncbi:MAG: cytochrome c biogenesis protein CcsA [Chitinophagales bacterium]